MSLWRNASRARSTAPELRDDFSRPCVGLWAIGATEQHGPHLVTGFDHLVAQAIVGQVASELPTRAVVLPFLGLGCSAHWLGFGATLSLELDTMMRVIRDVCRSAGEAGLRQLVIVNGHAGNVGVAMAAVGSLFDELCQVHFVSYWDLIGGESMRSLLRIDDGVGHAGEFETSIGLALGDRFVRPAAVPSSGEAYIHPIDRVGVYRPVQIDPTESSGVVGDPTAAEAKTGQELFELACAGLKTYCLSLVEK